MRILIDPDELTGSSSGLRLSAEECRVLAEKLRFSYLPAMPSGVYADIQTRLMKCSKQLEHLSTEMLDDARDLAWRSLYIRTIENSGGVVWWRLFSSGLMEGKALSLLGRLLGNQDLWSWRRDLGAYRRGSEWEAARRFGLFSNLLTGSISQRGFAGVDASLEEFAVLDRNGLRAGVRGQAFVGIRQEFEAQASAGPVTARARGSVMVGATTRGEARLGVGPTGISAHAGGEAFAGGKAEGSASVEAYGVNAKAKASVSYGIGVKADIDTEFSMKKVKVNFDLGGTLGFGGSIGASVEVSPDKLVKSTAKGIARVVSWGNPFG